MNEETIEEADTKEAKGKKSLRIVERFVTKPKTSKSTFVKGHWKIIGFGDLKKGDVYRLWDKIGDSRVPDYLVDGKHDVCVALSDAYEDEGVGTIKCLSINGF